MKPKYSTKLPLACLSAFTLAFSSANLSAASMIWDSDPLTPLAQDGAGNWTVGGTTFYNNTTATNNQATTNNITTDIATFGNGGTLASPATVNVSTQSIAGLIFGATTTSGYNLTGSGAVQVLTVGASGIVLNSGAQATTLGDTNLGITLGAAQSWTNNSASLSTVGGAVTNGGFLLTSTGAGNTAISGAISGAGGLTKSGAGTLTLSGLNTYTGNTVVSGGTLQINGSYTGNSTAVASLLLVGAANGTSGTVIIGSGAGTLSFGGDGYGSAAQVGTNGGTGALTLNGGTVNISGASGQTAALNIGGMATGGTGTVTVNSGSTLNIGGRILMASNTVAASGTLTINGGAVNVGYSGGLSFAVNQPGILRMGGGTSAVNLNSGTLSLFAFQSDSGNAANTVINFNGGTLKALGTPNFFLSNGANNAVGAYTTKVKVNGAIIDTNTFNITITTALVEDGASTGGGLTKQNTGTLTLSNAGNTYTGVTTISGGILNAATFAAGTANSSIGNPGTAAANKLVINGGTLQYTGTAAASTDRLFTIGTGGAILNASGTTAGTLSFTSSGNIAFSSSAAPAALTLTGTGTGATGAGSLASIIGDSGTGANITSLTKSGTGTWTLTGANTYTGTTTITGGILNAATFAAVNTASSIGKGSAGGSASDLTINGGTLQYTGTTAATTNRLFTIGTGGATLDASGTTAGTLSFTGAGNIAFSSSAAPAALTLTGTGTGATGAASLASIIGDSGTGANITSLTKSGTGTWTLTGANTYSGSTLVNAGTLIINGGSKTGSGLIDIGSVGNAANFTLTTGNVTAGSQFVIGAHGSTGTAAINGGALQVNGAIFAGGYGGGTGTGTMTQTAGTVTSTGGVNFGGGGPNSGVYNLSGGTLTTSSIAKNSTGAATATFNFNGGTLKPSANTFTMTGLTTANVQAGGALIDTNTFSITIAQALVHDSALGATLDGGLTKLNTGTLTLSGASTYTGATTIKNGTIALASAADRLPTVTTLTLGDGVLNTGGILSLSGNSQQLAGLLTAGSGTNRLVNGNAAAATLTLNIASGTNTFGGILGGGAANENNFALTKSGNGTLLLTGANTYAVATNVNGGTLRVSGAGLLGTGAATVTGSGSILDLDRNDTWGDAASSVQALTIQTGGLVTNGTLINRGFNQVQTLALNGGELRVTGTANVVGFEAYGIRNSVTVTGTTASSITNPTSVANAGINIGGYTNLGGGVGASLTFNVADVTSSSATDLTVSAVLKNTPSLSNGLIKSGVGTMTLSGTRANTFTGLTTVTAGTLALNKTAGINAIASNVGGGGNDKTTDILVNGGALNWLASDQVSNNASINVTSGSVNFGSANETIYDFNNNGGSVNYGTGNVTITDPNWTAGSNTVSGNTTFGVLNVSGGTNTVTGTNTGGAGVLTVGGAGGLNFSGTASPNITINSDSATAGKLVLTENVTSTVTSGTASITNGLAGANPGQLDLGAATRTFSVDNGSAAVDLSIGTQIINGGLTKTGGGTLEVAVGSASTYTGATNVNGGTLLVNGSISTSVTTVAATATIGGSGTTGALTVQSGGFITPGNSAGILSTGNYTQLGLYTAEINGLTAGTQHDQINVTGTVNITGGSLATLFTGSYALNDMIFILLNDGLPTDTITGTFTGLDQGATAATFGGFDWKISYQGNSGGSPSFLGGNDIVLQAIPEPSAALLGAIGLLALLRRRR